MKNALALIELRTNDVEPSARHMSHIDIATKWHQQRIILDVVMHL